MTKHWWFLALGAFVRSTTHGLLEKRNPCDGYNAEPILYHDYDNDACPPYRYHDDKGNCKVERSRESRWYGEEPVCGTFCESKTTFIYGRESIFLAHPYCHGPMTCTITDTTTTSLGFTISLPISNKYSETFTAGVSGGITYSNSWAHAESKSVNLKQNECGYFTFVPIMKVSCGTWTEAEYKDVDGWMECVNPVQRHDVCVTVPGIMHGTKDDPDGVTIFVRVDCSNHEPLGPDMQDPTFNRPGVPLDRGVRSAIAKTWEDPLTMQGSLSEIECPSTADGDLPAINDCADAIGLGLETDIGKSVERKKKDEKWLAYVQKSCAIQVEYTQDWDDSCVVGMAEVFRAAAGVLDKCKNQSTGKVTGSRALRTDGKCSSILRLGAPEQKHMTKALNIVLEEADFTWFSEIKWLFYVTDFGSSSVCTRYPVAVKDNEDKSITTIENKVVVNGVSTTDKWFPAGTYDVKLPDGVCQYKNDGTNNPGALWCGSTFKAACKASPSKDLAGWDGTKKCTREELPYEADEHNQRQYIHRAVVVCEW